MAWTKLVDLLGTARMSAVGFSIGTTGYVGLGVSLEAVMNNDFWAYNSTNNTWSQKAVFPGAGRRNAVGFSIGSKGYVGLGIDTNTNTGYKDFYEYNPSPVNVWTRKIDFPAEARHSCVSFGIGVFGYIGLGILQFNNSRTGQVYRFDPAGNGSWAFIATAFAAAGAVAFIINSKAYIGLGNTISGNTDTIREFNPVGNVWTTKDSFGGGVRADAIAFVTTGNKGYVGLGKNNSGVMQNDLWEFDPALGSGSQWKKVYGFIGLARYSAVGFGIGGKGYVGLGSSGILQKDFYEYNPASMSVISQTLISKWGILNYLSVPKTFDFKWNILDSTPISQNIQIKWNIANFILLPEVSLISNWNILINVPNASHVFNFDINPKSVVGPIEKQFLWDIDNFETVENSVICEWNITYDFVSQDLECLWNMDFKDVRSSVTCKWDMDGLVELPDVNLECLWDIISETVENSVICEWNIDGKVDIYPKLECTWNIESEEPISNDLECLWNISGGTVSAKNIFNWDIRGYVKNKLECNWDIATEGKPRYIFESEERNKVFRREVIGRKQLTTTNE